MNREIKFRAWDKRFKTMGFGSGGLLLRINSKDFSNPMQYTGLKDKNGKEIYEGDIVKTKRKGEGITRVGEVTYDENVCAYYLEPGKMLSEYVKYETFEAIGNVFENKELLN